MSTRCKVRAKEVAPPGRGVHDALCRVTPAGMNLSATLRILRVRAWNLAFWSGVFLPLFSLPGSAAAGSNPYASDEAPQAKSKIDQLVFGKLAKLGIKPANVCTDAVFVRRAYLDVLGTLPTAEEAAAFIRDSSPAKRSALISSLLERPEYGDYWGMRWSDLLRVRAEFPINLWPNAAQAYDRWIRDSLRNNLPYDRFLREMLTANGSNFRVGQVNFYRAVQDKTPEGIARAVALTFMGERADKWPSEKLAGMAKFFSKITYKPTGEWKEEIVFFDPRKDADAVNKSTVPSDAPSDRPPAAAGVATPDFAPLAATFPDGKQIRIPASQDPRLVFANWLISADNPAFTRCLVNRLWAWLLGRGIIHEPDDIRPDNPPQNPELLAYLQSELVSSQFNLKHVIRLILDSEAYQLAPPADPTSQEARANFAGYPLRRLEAEVLMDAVNQITGTTEGYSSPVPEPFTFIPDDQRSICLPDASITSSFLEMFGRPARDTGLMSERAATPTMDQRLYLLNSSHIQTKIENSPKLRSLFISAAESKKSKKSDKRSKNAAAASASLTPAEIANKLYLLILSRYPTEEEMRAVADYSGRATSRRDVVFDLAWALINSAEFLYRH